MLILIQKGRGGGLSSAFGGGGGSAAFGAKTGDVLTWLTSSFFAVFIILAIVLDLVVNSQYKLTTPEPSKTTAVIPASATPDTSTVTTTPPDATPAVTPAPPIDAATTPMQNPAQQLGSALDQKLKQAIAPTTQKAGDAVKPLLPQTTQPK